MAIFLNKSVQLINILITQYNFCKSNQIYGTTDLYEVNFLQFYKGEKMGKTYRKMIVFFGAFLSSALSFGKIEPNGEIHPKNTDPINYAKIDGVCDLILAGADNTPIVNYEQFIEILVVELGQVIRTNPIEYCNDFKMAQVVEKDPDTQLR